MNNCNQNKFQLNYSDYKTDTCKKRRSAATRELTKLAYQLPKDRIISLAEGMPDEKTFPFTEISVSLVDGSQFVLEGSELDAALQYLPSKGYPPLVEAIRDFQRKVHAPPKWESREVLVVAGAQDGLSKALEAIIGPGDPILIQSPFYSGVDIVVAPLEAELIPIKQDNYGICPKFLKETLEKRKISGLPMPKLMYINATGANPIGTVIPNQRRLEIYKIACEYDFLLLDDDPYHFVYFTEDAPTSFLSIDTEGRVIRLDSFSKVFSSGLRIGIITAPAPLISSIELHMQSSHTHAPTLSQVILYKLFNVWGYDKILDHFRNIRTFYKKRRDNAVKLAEQHLNGLAEFSKPSAGLFLWIKVLGVKDSWKMVMQRGIKHGILVAPGAAFMADQTVPCNTIRVCFSKASYTDMSLAMKRLASLIQEELANYR